MNTLVISNIHRAPKILPYLEGFNPIRSLSPDYVFCCIGQMRCYHGHLIALKCYMTDETAMVFEDDAVPFEDVAWKESIEAANKMVLEKGYDIVCFSGRGFDFNKFDKISEYGFDWLVPHAGHRWVLGTLAYLTGRKVAAEIIKQDFWLHRTNMDMFLWGERFNFLMLDPRQFVKDKTLSETLIGENPPPFIHACGAETSVIANPRNVECVIR